MRFIRLQVCVLCAAALAISGDIAMRAEPPSPVPRPVAIGAGAPVVQATIYSGDWCLPCIAYLTDVRRELPPDGWRLADAGTKQAATAHIVISKTHVPADKVSSLPTTIIRRNGIEVDRLVGRVTPLKLSAALNRAAKQALNQNAPGGQ